MPGLRRSLGRSHKKSSLHLLSQRCREPLRRSERVLFGVPELRYGLALNSVHSHNSRIRFIVLDHRHVRKAVAYDGSVLTPPTQPCRHPKRVGHGAGLGLEKCGVEGCGASPVSTTNTNQPPPHGHGLEADLLTEAQPPGRAPGLSPSLPSSSPPRTQA